MVMKIAHAQLHMYTNIMYKFQSSTCKTVGEKLRTKLCPWMDERTDRQADGRTAMAIPVNPPPLRCGGYNYFRSKRKMLSFQVKFRKDGQFDKVKQYGTDLSMQGHKNTIYLLRSERVKRPSRYQRSAVDCLEDKKSKS